MGVSFDGPNKLIICSTGTTELSVASDVYSAWKRWVILSDNSKYLQAISSIGGDPLYGVVSLGSTFFLENDWKIRPYEGDHTLTVNGNLYSRDGSSSFVQTLGTFNVLVSMARSNLIDTVSTSGGTGPTVEQIASGVWNRSEVLIVTPASIGVAVKNTKMTVEDNQALILAK